MPISVLGILLSIILITVPGISILAKLYFWSTISVCFIQYLMSHAWYWCVNANHNTLIYTLLIWMLIRSQNFYGLINWGLFAILMVIFMTNLPYRSISKAGLLCLSYLVVIVGVIVRVKGGFYTNTNIGAIITAIVIVLTYIYFPKYRVITILIGVPTIVLYDSRSVLLALGLSVSVIHIVKNRIAKLKTLLLVLVVIVGGGMFILWDILMSPEFNTFVFETTNKNFQSGRNLIWGAIFEYMQGWDWVVGVGGGVHHGAIVPDHFKNMSLHSTYIFMLFHYGWIGLSLLLLLFYKVLKDLTDKGYFYSATVFLFFVLRDFFEITLINNQMAIAVLFWGWIANGWIDKNYAISKSISYNNSSRDSKQIKVLAIDVKKNYISSTIKN